MFAVRATYHTALQASPMQLVFGHDAILNVKHVTDWEHINEHKQRTSRMNYNNKRENAKRLDHNYEVGDQVLVKNRKHSKHEQEYIGPYKVAHVNNNGTIRYQKGIVNDTINICQIKPYFTSNDQNENTIQQR